MEGTAAPEGAVATGVREPSTLQLLSMLLSHSSPPADKTTEASNVADEDVDRAKDTSMDDLDERKLSSARPVAATAEDEVTPCALEKVILPALKAFDKNHAINDPSTWSSKRRSFSSSSVAEMKQKALEKFNDVFPKGPGRRSKSARGGTRTSSSNSTGRHKTGAQLPSNPRTERVLPNRSPSVPGSSSQQDKAVSSKDFQQLSILYNECSLAAISNWAAGKGKYLANPTSQNTASSRTYHRPVPAAIFRRCNQCEQWGHYDSECADLNEENIVKVAEAVRMQSTLSQFVQDDICRRSANIGNAQLRLDSSTLLSFEDGKGRARPSALKLHEKVDPVNTQGKQDNRPMPVRAPGENGTAKGDGILPDQLARRGGREVNGGYLIRTNACEVCGSGFRSEDLLLCDGCDCLFHIQCLDPPLDRIPEGDWFCSKCENYDSDVSSVIELEGCNGFVIEQRKKSGYKKQMSLSEQMKGVGFADDSWSVPVGVMYRSDISDIASKVIEDRAVAEPVESTMAVRNIPGLATGELCWAKRGAAPVGALARDDWWPAMVVQVSEESRSTSEMPYLVKFYSLIGVNRARPTEVLPFFLNYEDVGHSRLFAKSMQGYDVYRNALNTAIAEAGFRSLSQVLQKAREMKSEGGKSRGSASKRSKSHGHGKLQSPNRGRPDKWKSADSVVIDGIEILSKVDEFSSSSQTMNSAVDSFITSSTGGEKRRITSATPDLSVDQTVDTATAKRRKTDNLRSNGVERRQDLQSVEQLVGGLVAWIGQKYRDTGARSSVGSASIAPVLNVGVGCSLDLRSGQLLVRTLSGIDDIFSRKDGLPGRPSRMTTTGGDSEVIMREKEVNDEEGDGEQKLEPLLALHCVNFGASFWVPNESLMVLDAAPKLTEVATIAVPAGPLGINIKNRQDFQGTVVSSVRASSVLATKLGPGDRIIAIDGEDVSQKTTTEVRKIVAEKAKQERLLTVLGGGSKAIQRQAAKMFCEEQLLATLRKTRDEFMQHQQELAAEREEGMVELTAIAFDEASDNEITNQGSREGLKDRNINDASDRLRQYGSNNNNSSSKEANTQQVQKESSTSQKVEQEQVVGNGIGPSSSSVQPASSDYNNASANDNEESGEVHLGDNIYIAECILDEKTTNRKTQYLVKWKGTDEKTWEPSQNILNRNLVDIFIASRALSLLRKTPEAKDKETATFRIIRALEKGGNMLKNSIHIPISAERKTRICPFCETHFNNNVKFSGHYSKHTTEPNCKVIKDTAKILERSWFE